MLPRVRDIRRGGSAALDLAWTAAGRYDAYYERGVKPWDIAAGALLCARAGLEVHELPAGDGAAAPGMLVAPPALAGELLEPSWRWSDVAIRRAAEYAAGGTRTHTPFGQGLLRPPRLPFRHPGRAGEHAYAGECREPRLGAGAAGGAVGPRARPRRSSACWKPRIANATSSDLHAARAGASAGRGARVERRLREARPCRGRTTAGPATSGEDRAGRSRAPRRPAARRGSSARRRTPSAGRRPCRRSAAPSRPASSSQPPIVTISDQRRRRRAAAGRPIACVACSTALSRLGCVDDHASSRCHGGVADDTISPAAWRRRGHGRATRRAGVVELVDTPALGAGGASLGGSSPSARMTPPRRVGATARDLRPTVGTKAGRAEPDAHLRRRSRPPLDPRGPRRAARRAGARRRSSCSASAAPAPRRSCAGGGRGPRGRGPRRRARAAQRMTADEGARGPRPRARGARRARRPAGRCGGRRGAPRRTGRGRSRPSAGSTSCGWTADTHDWRGDARARDARRDLRRLRDGAIVLAHDGIGPGRGARRAARRPSRSSARWSAPRASAASSPEDRVIPALVPPLVERSLDDVLAAIAAGAAERDRDPGGAFPFDAIVALADAGATQADRRRRRSPTPTSSRCCGPSRAPTWASRGSSTATSTPSSACGCRRRPSCATRSSPRSRPARAARASGAPTPCPARASPPASRAARCGGRRCSARARAACTARSCSPGPTTPARHRSRPGSTSPRRGPSTSTARGSAAPGCARRPATA